MLALLSETRHPLVSFGGIEKIKGPDIKPGLLEFRVSCNDFVT
jgi:hypothetical protein